MLGYDSDETQLVLKYIRAGGMNRDWKAMLCKRSYCEWQRRWADMMESRGVRVCSGSKTRPGPKPKHLVTWKHDERLHVSEIPPSEALYFNGHAAFNVQRAAYLPRKPSTSMDTLPLMCSVLHTSLGSPLISMDTLPLMCSVLHTSLGSPLLQWTCCL